MTLRTEDGAVKCCFLALLLLDETLVLTLTIATGMS